MCRAVEEHVLIGLILHCPDKARHRNIVLAHYGVGAVALHMIISHLISVVHIEFMPPNLRMCIREVHRHGLIVDFGASSLHLGRVGDIAVVGDSAILFVQEVVIVVESLHLIAVADV